MAPSPPPPVPLHYDSQLQFPLARLNLGIAITFGSLAVIAFVLRIIARRQAKAQLQGDDWIMFVAMLTSVGLCVMSGWAAIHGGLGVPAQYLQQSTAIAFLKQTFVQELLSTAAIGLIKVSVCLYYKRIFSANRVFLICINIMITLSIIWTLSFFLALTFSYWPVSGHWKLVGGLHTNLSFGALIIAMATTSVVLDFTVLSMPIPMIKRLQLSSRKKWIVGVMFGLGAFCVVASIVRLVYIVKFLHVSNGHTSSAFTNAENQIAIWSNIEPCASVLCGCLPTYGPFLKKFTKGESVLGSGLSAIVRAKLNQSTQWVRLGRSQRARTPGESSMSLPRKSENASINSINQVYWSDGTFDEIQIKNHGGITVSRTFAVSKDNDSKSNQAHKSN